MKGKKVFITVNPDLIAGKRLMTVRAIVSALDRMCELHIVPIDCIDFRTGNLTSYRRIPGGKFECEGAVEPSGDLWLVYTDGYYLDTAALSYATRMDYFDYQMQFYERLQAKGKISSVINTPAAERTTLKNWFTQINCQDWGVIPTFAARSLVELHDLLRSHGMLVAKPIWGGAGQMVRKLETESDVAQYSDCLQEYVFQVYKDGPEKRLWFTGGEFVAARICFGRKTPWSDYLPDYHAAVYDEKSGQQFDQDLDVARSLWQRTGLSIGAVDFIGDLVNEINGCGTIFTYYQYWTNIADARPQLVKYVTDLVRCA